jgi:hypothetical protein
MCIILTFASFLHFSVSSLAWFMSNQETSFATIGQRVLANPLRYAKFLKIISKARNNQAQINLHAYKLTTLSLHRLRSSTKEPYKVTDLFPPKLMLFVGKQILWIQILLFSME